METWKSGVRINKANPLVSGIRGRNSTLKRLPTPTTVTQSPGGGARGLPEAVADPSQVPGVTHGQERPSGCLVTQRRPFSSWRSPQGSLASEKSDKGKFGVKNSLRSHC